MNPTKLSPPARAWLDGIASHRLDLQRLAVGKDVPGLDEDALLREACDSLSQLEGWKPICESVVRTVACSGTRKGLASVILMMWGIHVGGEAVAARLKQQEWRVKGARAANRKRTGPAYARARRLIEEYEESTGTMLTPESPAGVRRTAADRRGLSERHLLRVLRARAGRIPQ